MTLSKRIGHSIRQVVIPAGHRSYQKVGKDEHQWTP